MPETQKNKRRYTSEFKESVLKRLKPPTSETVASLSDELGIPKGTIYAWLRAKDNNLNKPKSTKSLTSGYKFHVVLETSTLTEEELAAYCRRKGLFVEDVKAWREQCVKANTTKFKDPQKLELDLKEEKEKNRHLKKELSRKEKALAETAALLVLRKKAQAIWGGPRGRLVSTSDREKAVELIDEARAAGARLKPACEVMGISDRTYQRWTNGGGVGEDQRPLTERSTPKNKLREEEREKVIEVVNSPEFADLPPCKIVPSLADGGKYIASESTFYRILKEEKMSVHRNRSKEPVKREAPSHTATGPNQVWTWDITWLNASIKGQYFKLYMIVDIFSRLIVGYEVWETEKAEYAEFLVKKAVLAQGIQGRPLVLHSDNGSPMKAATFLATLEKLGVQSSFSRPRVSNDNPYSESLFKTMKYCPKYPFDGFPSLKDARQWVQKFVNWYNFKHLHSGINFTTPHQRHNGLDEKILENRKKVYEEAKARNPSRWSNNIRDWSLPEVVALNPIGEEELNLVAKEHRQKHA